jgi:hypothetical protein
MEVIESPSDYRKTTNGATFELATNLTVLKSIRHSILTF